MKIPGLHMSQYYKIQRTFSTKSDERSCIENTTTWLPQRWLVQHSRSAHQRYPWVGHWWTFLTCSPRQNGHTAPLPLWWWIVSANKNLCWDFRLLEELATPSENGLSRTASVGRQISPLEYPRKTCWTPISYSEWWSTAGSMKYTSLHYKQMICCYDTD